MKSEDKARLTCINPCNKSTAKYQYSFAKEHRFTHNKTNNHSGTTFYDPPSTLVRRGGTLSRAKRDCQKNISDDKPAPGQYNPRVISAQGKVVFAPGRDKCANSSIFYNTTISYPGPGQYDPKAKHHTPQISIAGKVKNLYQTISPGPKYNFATSLLQKNKILSQQRKKGCIKLMPESNKSLITKTQQSEQNNKVNDRNQGYMSCKAKKSFGFSGVNATIGKDLRFRATSAKQKTPGPGQYDYFSQFIKLTEK